MLTRILIADDHTVVRFGLPALPELAAIIEAGIGEDGAWE